MGFTVTQGLFWERWREGGKREETDVFAPEPKVVPLLKSCC